MLRNFSRMAVISFLAASAALAYDGPRATPRPRVNGSFGPIQVHEGSTEVSLAWDLRPWIAQSFSNHRPDRAFFEVKFGSDFVSDTDSIQADRAARVDSGGNLFLHGARTIDIASYGRGAGDYYIRMVAKRGGNGPDDDVARRSASVRVSLSAQVADPGTVSSPPVGVFPGTLPTGPISNEPADKVEVLSLALNPTAPAADEAFTASARIRNRTGRTLQVPWKIVWFGDVPTPRIGDGTATLQPYGEIVVQGYRPAPTGILGESRIVVYLDPERTLGESDDARQNNYKVVHNDFPAQPVASPDQVQAVWISTSSETPGTNQALTVMFVVKNLTNRELRNVEYRILMDGGNEVTFGRIASLAAGQQVEVRGTVPGSWLTTAGPRLFTGIVDPDNRLNESSMSQGNNAVDKSVTVYRTVQR